MEKASALREALAPDRILEVLGAGDGLTAILAERFGFDAIWASGFGICASVGVPDASILTMTEFLHGAVTIDRATSLPVIADCDTGFGDANNVARMVQMYEGAGIAAVCIEDKEFPKRNSFLEGQRLADPEEFAGKIFSAKEAQQSRDFIVIARLESLVAGAPLEEALTRASLYCAAGADAILVHSKSDVADEVLAFASEWKASGSHVPLFAVPTTYHGITSGELASGGISAVIYANQALRAAVTAIEGVLAHIATASSSSGVEARLATLAHVFGLVRTEELLRREDWVRGSVSRIQAGLAREPGPEELAHTTAALDGEPALDPRRDGSSGTDLVADPLVERTEVSWSAS